MPFGSETLVCSAGSYTLSGGALCTDDVCYSSPPLPLFTYLTYDFPSMYELRNGERISVAAASKLLHNTLYGYKGYGLVVVRNG